jgi:thioredoxin-related protein
MRIPILAFLLLMPLMSLGGVAELAPKGTFQDSFLVFPEDVRDAARDKRRVIVFFEQEGCPACLRMAKETFADAAVAARLRKEFVLIALDTFGARDTTWVDGRSRPEKDLARHLGIRGTPTVMILDERGQTAQSFVGFRDARAFGAILDTSGPR